MIAEVASSELEIQVLDIDHLGIVAGIIDEMGLVEQVNRLLGTHPQEKVSTGQVLKAMLLNALGFVSAPLYLFEQFFVGKATEHLIGAGVQPEHLNDDRLGNALDEFYGYGVSLLFSEIAMQAAQQFGVSAKSHHLDSSSFSVEGAYKEAESRQQEGTTGQPTEETAEPKAIRITYGYSRDGRADLKQFLLDTICSSDGDVPLYLRVADGNEADKAVFGKILREYRECFQLEGLYVADSSLYSEQNLRQLTGMQWLTRVPATVISAKVVMEQIDPSSWQEGTTPAYRFAQVCSDYGGIAQRWIIVESAERKAVVLCQLEKQLEKRYQRDLKRLQALSNQAFACAADAQTAVEKFSQSLKFHQLSEMQIVEQAHYPNQGRPKKGQAPTRLSYHIQASLLLNEQTVAAERARTGRFILATNVLDEQRLSPEQALAEYKDQQSNERGFRFLKDPLFFTSSVFLKSPQRIMALAMVMGLALLVYTLAQRRLRQALHQAQQSIANQVGKPTETPTMRWVFQCFQAVHLVTFQGVQQITNLTPVRRQILQLMGAACGRYYLLI